MTVLSKKTRADMVADPEYSRCCLQGYHECAGRITFEHALYFAGRKIQERYAVIPLCAQGHGVDMYQDAGTVPKEVRVWVALNRASDDELRGISKSTNYFRERDRLNAKYGLYVAPAVPDAATIVQKKPVLRTVHAPITTNGPESELEREVRAYARVNRCTIEEATETLTSLV